MPVSVAQPIERYQKFLLTAFGEAAQPLIDEGLGLDTLVEQAAYFRRLIRELKHRHAGGTRPIASMEYVFEPVDPETFLKDKYFLGLEEELYPEVVPYFNEINSGRYVEAVLTGGIGSAKCLGEGTPVLMFDGLVLPVERISIGDLLMGPDSSPRRVVSIASGVEELFRVTQLGGANYVVNKSHLLSLQYTDTGNRKRSGKIFKRYGASKGDLKTISVVDYLALSKRHRGLLKGWKPGRVDFQSCKVRDPYLLGLWLGDGDSHHPTFTSADEEIVSYLRLVAQKNGLLLTEHEDKRGNAAKRYSLCNYNWQRDRNPVLEWLSVLGVRDNKHIPHSYLTAPLNDRLLLLAGLLDTDGSLGGGTFVISQKRKKLADGIMFVARSCGFRASMEENSIKGTTYYRLFISGNVSKIPTRIARKKAKLREQVKDINRWGIKVESLGEGRYYGFELKGPNKLFLLGDFTVTHNTSLAVWTNAYQLFLLSCLRNPHAVYGLDRSSEIELIFQSITATLAETVDFARFKALITRSPYFQRHFLFDQSLKSELHFPNRIIVKPVSGSSLATIGQNVVGGLIDELNYMAVIEGSRRSIDEGIYNQAVSLYNSISRRRKSRYLKQGRLPGILCLVSSKKYPGQFTDQKAEEAKTDSTIYVYDKRVWEIKPDSFSDKHFKVFVGDEFRKPRILDLNEKMKKPDEALVIEVPEDFRTDFKRDIVDALREIAGMSHFSKSPFFTDPAPLQKMFNSKLVSVFSRDSVDFVNTQLEIIKKSLHDVELPRFAHIDLGLTADAAGLAIGHCPGFIETDRGGQVEMMPKIVFDGVLEVLPPKGGEIQFFKIRKILYLLRGLGMNIQWVSFDSWQSVDSLQLLKQRGFIVGMQSMDTTMVPYDFYKSAVYDGRVEMPEQLMLYRECKDLQIDLKKQKVDHLPQGKKDLADACAGVVYGLTTRRETWARYNVPISMLVVQAIKKADTKMKGDGKKPETPAEPE